MWWHELIAEEHRIGDDNESEVTLVEFFPQFGFVLTSQGIGNTNFKEWFTY